MKTVCIYHSIDLDGWMSAAIIKHWYNKVDGLPGDSIDFIGYNYGQPIPDLSEYDKVIMVDISITDTTNSLRPTITLAYKLGTNFIYIDHHISAISLVEEYIENDKSFNISGIRSTKFAACELTWQYFFPNEPMPEIVRLLGRYDCFGHKGTDEEQKVLEFQYGARHCISNYDEAYYYLDIAIRQTDAQMVENVIWREGRAVYKYLCIEAKQVYKNGFVIEFPYAGVEINNEQIILKHTFICINKERFNAINFGIDYHKNGYDGQACFHYANGVWNFSLYSQTVDCSIIAKQYGGGGHKGAAGFQIKDINQIIK